MPSPFLAVSRSKFLPAKGNRRKSLLLAVVVIVLWPLAAHAVNDPQVVTTFPFDGASIRSQNATELRVTFDRDLVMPPSWFVLYDGGATQVPGEFYLTGPTSPSGGQRSVAFRPSAPLDEAASPYHAFARGCPWVPGDCTTHNFTFVVDDTPPSIPTVSQPTDGSVVREQTVLVAGNADPGSRIVVVEDEVAITSSPAQTSGAFLLELPYGPEDGVRHTIFVHAVDDAGNASLPAPGITFIHDSVTDIPFITKPLQDAALNNRNVSVEGTAKAGSTVYIYDGSTFMGTTPVDPEGRWGTVINFTTGSHAVRAFSWDGYTWDGPSNIRNFLVDISAPAAPKFTAPLAGAFVRDRPVTVAGTAEANSTVTIRETGVGVRGTAQTSAAGTWTAEISFTDGPHTLTATATDRAGNTGASSTSLTFTVDTVAPVAPVITSPVGGSFVNTTAVAVSGRAEAGTTLLLQESKTTLGSTLVPASGVWTLTLPFTDGLHFVEAFAVDQAGNIGPRSDGHPFTVDTTPPPAPTLFSPPDGGQYVTREVFVAGTAEPNSRVSIHTATALLAKIFADHDGNFGTTLTFANGTYTITARATDLAGNLGPASPERTFVVGATSDTTPPPAPIINEPGAGSLQPGFVVFRGTAEPGSTVRIFEGGFALVSGTANGSGQWVVGANLVAGSHTIRANATDPSQNVSEFSPTRTFKVDSARPTVSMDLISPTIFLPLEGVIITGGATDDNGVKHIELEFDNKINGVRVLDHIAEQCTGCPNAPVRWTATPALPPGLYDVRAYAVDVVGNRSLPVTASIYVV